jgi:hypothetical protein
MLSFLKNKKGDQPENFLALMLKEDSGIAMVVTKMPNHASLEKKDEKHFTYSNSWDNIVDDIDEVLLTLEKDAKLSLHKVIFFLYSHMVDQDTGTIKHTYLSKIKKISKELDLKPLGYIEYHEAIARYLTKHEQIPLSALIIELDKPTLSIFLYKNGEMIFSQYMDKSGDIIQDLHTVLHKIKGNMVLPARIILYDSNKINSESSAIITYRFD